MIRKEYYHSGCEFYYADETEPFLDLDIEELIDQDISDDDIKPLSEKLQETVCKYLKEKTPLFSYKKTDASIKIYEGQKHLCNVYWNNPMELKDSDLETKEEAIRVAEKLVDLLKEYKKGSLEFPTIVQEYGSVNIKYGKKCIASFENYEDCKNAYKLLVIERYGQPLKNNGLYSKKNEARSIVSPPLCPTDVNITIVLYHLREYIQSVMSCCETGGL